MTLSEDRFEAYCRQAGIPFKRLQEKDSPTADYEVQIAHHRVIVEVKEYEANENEQQAVRDLQTQKSVSWSVGTLGNRVRNKIGESRRQIKALAAGVCPGVLLLYDVRPWQVRGIQPYEVLVALYGTETIDIHLSEQPFGPAKFGTHRFGKGKKLRPDTHTYISAIGVLRDEPPENRLHIDFYHNLHATHPLPIEQILERNDMTVFTVSPGTGNEFRGWARIVPGEE